MQKFEKIIAALLALIITTTSFTMVANADDSKIIEQCYTNANSEYTNLSVSGIKSTCIAKITTVSPMLLKIKMELQKQKTNRYETVETWTNSKTGTSLSMSEKRNINILNKYRLKTTFKVGSECIIKYSYYNN